MCFSPQADFVGGAIIAAIGVDSFRHVHQRHGHIAIASLPLLLAVHQIDEAFIWLGLQGHVPRSVAHVALWIYLLIAFVILPTFVPIAVLAFEPAGKRKLFMALFSIIGFGVSVDLLHAMLTSPFGVVMHPYHLSYSLRLPHPLLIIVLYIVAVCGALLCSSSRRVVTFGAINLIAIIIIARLTVDGFASVWCGWAAISSGAISLQLRRHRPHHLVTPENLPDPRVSSA